jgi:hypothetical protein
MRQIRIPNLIGVFQRMPDAAKSGGSMARLPRLPGGGFEKKTFRHGNLLIIKRGLLSRRVLVRGLKIARVTDVVYESSQKRAFPPTNSSFQPPALRGPACGGFSGIELQSPGGWGAIASRLTAIHKCREGIPLVYPRELFVE